MQQKQAIRIALYLVKVFILFHLCILTGMLTPDITWGGNLKNDSAMYTAEVLSIIINLFLGLILLIKGKYISGFISMEAVNVFLWCFLVFFCLNTIGNLLAETLIEKSLSIITLFFTYLIFMILRRSTKIPRT
jgi:DNA integrity scanning protein DisA with diadenylate cyclase activity